MLHWWRKCNTSAICAAQNTTSSCKALSFFFCSLCLPQWNQESTRWTSKIHYPRSLGIQARRAGHQKYTKSHSRSRSPSQTGTVRSYSEAKFAPGEVLAHSMRSPLRGQHVRTWPCVYGRRLPRPTDGRSSSKPPHAAEFESQNHSRRLLSHFVGSREPSVVKHSQEFVLFPHACANLVRAVLFVCVSPTTGERLHDTYFWILALWRSEPIRSGGLNIMGWASRLLL